MQKRKANKNQSQTVESEEFVAYLVGENGGWQRRRGGSG